MFIKSREALVAIIGDSVVDFYNSKNLIVLGPCVFTTRRGVLEKSFFKINFIGVKFEDENETREKIWSDFVTEQNEMWREKSGFLFISLFYREIEV